MTRTGLLSSGFAYFLSISSKRGRVITLLHFECDFREARSKYLFFRINFQRNLKKFQSNFFKNIQSIGTSKMDSSVRVRKKNPLTNLEGTFLKVLR